jgi:hypothetical protein
VRRARENTTRALNVKRIWRRDAAPECVFTPALLEQWQRETTPSASLLEWNGMWCWTRSTRHAGAWLVYQEFFFATRAVSSTTTQSRHCVRQLKSCELVVFNRFDRRGTSRLPQIVRAGKPPLDIAYEDRRQGAYAHEDRGSPPLRQARR